MYTEDQKTQAINNSQTFTELERAIKEYWPFVSYSRSDPIEWNYESIMHWIFQILDGWPYNTVTRANWLRYKVIELVEKLQIHI